MLMTEKKQRLSFAFKTSLDFILFYIYIYIYIYISVILLILYVYVDNLVCYF